MEQRKGLQKRQQKCQPKYQRKDHKTGQQKKIDQMYTYQKKFLPQTKKAQQAKKVRQS
jgi:hypothetical protein